ncbi:MAG: AMP-binding protein [Geodermatophilaceae bacterium]|nr:AMP-binding protein [Geodermatophilaceae bacterium]MDQ3476461.1 AMP-binding protein [Actinomycetota bacterium]
MPSSHVDTYARDNLPPADQWPEMLYDLPELDYPEQLNAAGALLDRGLAASGADRPCLLAPDGTSWTYGDVAARTAQVAHVLTEDLGVVPGNRVLLRGPNNPWLVVSWLAALQAGAVVVSTMSLLRSGEIGVVGEISAAQFAICDHRFVEDLETAALPGLITVTYGSDAPDDLSARAADKPTTYEAVPTSADDAAILAFTSGTTGRPKATMHFHRDLLATCDTFGAYVLKAVREDVFTGTPPLAFTYGLGGTVLFPLSVGAAILLVERASPDELAGHIAAHRVSVLFTAPTAYRALAALPDPAQLASLRRCVSAGETLPKAVFDAFQAATGLQIIDGIGSTEMLHIFIASADDEIRPGATGLVVPGYVGAVLDEDGNEVAVGELGRLAVKGPTGCRYLADDRQSVYVQNGWNLTGDTYTRDADGYFWYQARSDDMIISSGYNIAGPEVEAALLGHADVLECGVVGLPDAERTMLVTAYVVLRDGVAGDDAKAKELQDHAKATIAPYKYPRRIEFVDQLPRTNTGKLQRFRLRTPDADADADVASATAATAGS